MMSTLKPHLFSEMLDILAFCPSRRRSRDSLFKWRFCLPSTICAFAMSSQHAYKIVAYLLKNVLTDVSHSVAGWVKFDCPFALHRLSFEMSETRHIRALMRIAGQYCTSVSYRGPSKYLEWHKPIFDGLSMNEIMSSTKALQNERVMKAVCKGRKVHNSITTPPSHYCLPLDLDWVGDGVIKELIVYPIVRLQPRGFQAWDGLKIERMEFPDGDGGIFRRDVLHPYRPQAAYLKFIRMNRRIVVETAIQMLKRHLFLKEIHFNHFEFNPPKRLNFEATLKHIQTKIDQLWKFMVAHPGTNITVKCPRQDRLFNNDTDKLNTVQRLLSSEFVLEATQYHVICKLMKTQALKTLEVHFVV